VVAPTPDDSLEAGDELVFVCTTEVEEDVRSVVLGTRAPK
jgi:trk system potassium uptake protein TrkA